MIEKIKTKYLLESLAFAFVIFLLAGPALASEITEKNIIDLVNGERAKEGLPAFLESPTLFEVARAKMDDMVQKNYFAHTSPEGVTPWYFFGKVGYNYKYAGENLAINFFSAEDQMKAWMDSPTHKKNILSSNFQEIGVAVGKGTINGKSSIVAVQEFGTKVGAPVGAGKEDVLKTKNVQSAPGSAPVVLAKESIKESQSKIGKVSGASSWLIDSVKFFENLMAFFVMLSIVLVPMVFLSRVFEKFWLLWEQRERKVRVRFVN